MKPGDLEARLVAIVGTSAVLTAASDVAPYLTDWRGRYTGKARCIVKPATTEEIAGVIALCASECLPMVPQGGNTGLVGGATPDASGEAVVINLSRLNRIRELDAGNNTITVEAGCLLQQVQEAADEADRLFPLMLASQGSCEIGGNLSTNAGGVHVMRYGNMRELALGVEVVLPDGRVWNGLRGLRKDNTGYDLKQLFIGAEGTLGIITVAVLKLFPKPRANAVAWAAVDDPEAAVNLLCRLRGALGERIIAFEIVGRPALDLVLQHIPDTHDPLPERHDWYVLIECADTLAEFDLVTALEAALMAEFERGVRDATIARSLAQAQALWHLRENISEAQRIEGFSIKHDIAIPVSRIAEFIAQAGRELQQAFGAVRVVVFGHMGDGNLHYNLSRPAAADNDAFIAQTPLANRIVHDIVASLGGSISAEHGLGQLKRDEIRRYKSEIEIEMMRTLKAALDPHGLMNPGKLV